MASSDDEAEALPELVSDYYFEGEDDEPISFSVLTFQWRPNKNLDGKKKYIFLRGTADDGLQKIHKPVKAWSFSLSRMNPEISVLAKENHWIKLKKPKKSYVCVARTALITVNCLHIMKKNPETSEKSLWVQLSKTFSLLDPRPSVNDLIDHLELVEVALRRYASLSKSQFIMTFLGGKPQKERVSVEHGMVQTSFIVDDDGVSDDDGDEDQIFDSVCAICDDGGMVTVCDGICMRSFHASLEDAEQSISGCSSLGYSKKEIDAMPTFVCKNCLHKQHQCFSCGQLGSSDKTTSGVAEVFKCASAACGYFYHPRCLAKLHHPCDAAAAEELEKNVAGGVPFTCPSHNCCVCKQLENHTVVGLHFAVCRRCPTSYHFKCLPREISFEDTKGNSRRAWEKLLRMNNRILIYCLKHKIRPDLGTPVRNHLKFPGDTPQRQNPFPASSSRKTKLTVERKGSVSEIKTLKKAVPMRHFPQSVQQGQSSKKVVRGSLPLKRKTDAVTERHTEKLTDAVTERHTEKLSIKRQKDGFSSIGENKGSFRARPIEKCCRQSNLANPTKFKDSRKSVQTASRQSDSLLDELDPASKERIENIIKEAESSFTHGRPRNDILESFTQGRIEDLFQAMQMALRKLDNGCDIKEAEAVCGPNVLNKILKGKVELQKVGISQGFSSPSLETGVLSAMTSLSLQTRNKFRVYISPFLYGMRYTSFGRHFTKVDKLKEIVDKIHWYVDDGDTVVDFCCGANDFSCLMKDKLEETGKKCAYRNFDLFRPKNDFCFEKRDWMTVQPSELPEGSKLVMGLNPPFGVRASLANKFINKALEFRPKLIILVVPPETERLDKKSPYDLVWEDHEKLSGRSFYLPGSVDLKGKQMEDWNVIPPVIYLWSRRKWTSKFRKIAEKHGHLRGKQILQRHRNKEVPLEVNIRSSSYSKIDYAPAQPKKTEEPDKAVEALVKDCGVLRLEEKNVTFSVGHDHISHGRNLAEGYHDKTNRSPANELLTGESESEPVYELPPPGFGSQPLIPDGPLGVSAMERYGPKLRDGLNFAPPPKFPGSSSGSGGWIEE